jgi:hypothetical protein
MEHLERDGTVVAEIVGEIHGCHATPAELSLNPVVRGKTFLEDLERSGHGRRRERVRRR